MIVRTAFVLINRERQLGGRSRGGIFSTQRLVNGTKTGQQANGG